MFALLTDKCWQSLWDIRRFSCCFASRSSPGVLQRIHLKSHSSHSLSTKDSQKQHSGLCVMLVEIRTCALFSTVHPWCSKLMRRTREEIMQKGAMLHPIHRVYFRSRRSSFLSCLLMFLTCQARCRPENPPSPLRGLSYAHRPQYLNASLIVEDWLGLRSLLCKFTDWNKLDQFCPPRRRWYLSSTKYFGICPLYVFLSLNAISSPPFTLTSLNSHLHASLYRFTVIIMGQIHIN